MKKLIESIKEIRLKLGFKRLIVSLSEIKKSMNCIDVMDFLFSKKGALIRPWQYESEIKALLGLYESLNARQILEIGTANGGTLFGHCRLANKEARIISVDLPGENLVEVILIGKCQSIKSLLFPLKSYIWSVPALQIPQPISM